MKALVIEILRGNAEGGITHSHRGALYGCWCEDEGRGAEMCVCICVGEHGAASESVVKLGVQTIGNIQTTVTSNYYFVCEISVTFPTYQLFQHVKCVY